MTETRRLIDKDDPDLPDNIYALEGESWEQALWDIEAKLKQAPYSAGHYTNPEFEPSPELDALLKRLVNSELLDDWDYGFTNEEDVDNLLTIAFNEMAFDGGLDEGERKTLNELKGYLSGVIKPLLKVWPGETQVSLQFRGREKTLNKLSSHIDLGAAGKSKDWCTEAFNDVSFYVLLPFNSVGTAFHNYKDVTSEGKVKEVKPGGLKSFYNPKAQSRPEDLWYAKPWSTSVLVSHIWTHLPPLHSQPLSINGQTEKRCLAFMAVSRCP